LFSRPAYRTRQFFGALRPHVREMERDEAAQVLGTQLTPLFESMSARDQRHCFDVYRTLVDYRCRDHHTLLAALLHDAGKGRLAGARVRLWHRVAYVTLAGIAPSVLKRLANPDRRGGKGGLASLYHHCERGAVVAEALGAPAEVVDLIRRHEDAGEADERLRLLRMADDSN